MIRDRSSENSCQGGRSVTCGSSPEDRRQSGRGPIWNNPGSPSCLGIVIYRGPWRRSRGSTDNGERDWRWIVFGFNDLRTNNMNSFLLNIYIFFNFSIARRARRDNYFRYRSSFVTRRSSRRAIPFNVFYF